MTKLNWQNDTLLAAAAAAAQAAAEEKDQDLAQLSSSNLCYSQLHERKLYQNAIDFEAQLSLTQIGANNSKRLSIVATANCRNTIS